MTGTIRVGTSGWSYDDWNGTFYPEELPRDRWFEHYAERFDTVEINNTFYRLPPESTVTRWHDQSPDLFRYAVKGSRYVTHMKKLNDPEEGVGNVVDRLQGLKTYLGVWLWQLPPNQHKDIDKLARFVDTLPGRWPHAIEFRHASWWNEDVYDVLRERDVAFVWLSDKQMPDERPLTSQHVYVRFHGLGGQDQRYRYDYRDDELQPWADRLRELAEDDHDGWVYFNNDYDANAPRNAHTLIDQLGEFAHGR
ncbi:MAG: DUF72 domain-containing protein [Actinobacteria bacterium]|nr:DUF72 domain-containing protein [Actinomycetota bacterium]